MASKRKRGDDVIGSSSVVHRPEAGTKSFASGSAVRDGLATGTRQALVSFHQQIVTPFSSLPPPITHATVVILQHYLNASPTADEIFNAWKHAQDSKDERLAESSALLLSQIIRILTPLPFFHKQLVAIVTKLVSPTEPFADQLARLLQSGKRENLIAGLALAAAAVQVDKPDPTALSGSSSRGRLAGKVWASIAEGGSAKAFGKMLGMRKRTKDGAVDYGDKDPMDRPDIRHLAMDVVLPLLSTTAFHTYAKNILPPLYSGLALDPDITIFRVLTAMWNAISGPPTGVGRRISLVLLDESAIDNISGLLNRVEKTNDSGPSVADMAQGFLEGVTCTPGRGICFQDEGWYPRDDGENEEKDVGEGSARRGGRAKRGVHNPILNNVVKRLGTRAVDDEGRVGSWAVKMFAACPELVAGYWPNSALALDPRFEARWFATMAYVGRVISLPLPDRSTFNQVPPRGTDASSMPPRTAPPAVSTIVESILPSPLTKQHLSKGLQHTEGLIQYVTALTLARGLQKLAAVQQLYASIADELGEDVDARDGAWTKGARDLEIECRRRVPEVSVIVAFAQKSATMARAAPDSDDEVEPKIVDRSALLTEAALRLFGLYYKTLPSLASESRFDAGKLLVSASSRNAERRARREAREGSVISDSGSVGSVGTLGTVGMGGGFGQARGDVEGFEALSQLHVLRLLSEVKDWAWINKAAGSQYTYLYHVLQLHMSTRNFVTQTMTTTLLHRLLQSSMLFEHDTLELPIWLNALPYASDAVSGPMFLAQQIYLLSFIDECARRTLKTPHRYIEETAAVVPGLTPQAMASPWLVTMVEQLNAKLLGMHMATEAAAVVLNYLRRVLVGLLEKQADSQFVRAIVSRITQAIQAARDAGQPRHGLSEIVDLLNSDLDVIFGGKAMIAVDPQMPRLVDEQDYIARSFERQCLLSFQENGNVNLRHLAHAINTAKPDASARQAQFLVHFLEGSRSDESKRILLDLLAVVLRRVRGSTSDAARRLKAAVFNSPIFRELFLGEAGNHCRGELSAVSASLLSQSVFDKSLAEPYAFSALQAVEDKKVADSVAYATIHPWIAFLNSTQVEAALKRTVRRSIKHKGSEAGREVLHGLLAVSTPAMVYPQLAPLLQLGAYEPVASVLRNAASKSLTRRLDVNVGEDVITDLVSKHNDGAFELLALLVSLSSSIGLVFTSALTANPSWLDDHRVLPAMAALDSIPEALSNKAANAAVAALSNPILADDIHASATRILVASRQHADVVNKALATVAFSAFGLPLAKTVLALANTGDANFNPALTSLISIGMQSATRLFSSYAELAGGEIETIEGLGEAIRKASALRVEVDSGLAEPVIMAVTSDRLEVPAALDFAALLASKAMLKAGFVRQQLQSLIASKVLARLSLPPAAGSVDPTLRLAFIRLLHGLFMASTYVSCQPNFIEPLVPLYRGTLGTADRILLALFQTFENQRKLSVTSVLRHWSADGASVSQRGFDALTSLDDQRVFATCTKFPLRRCFTAAPESGDAEANEELYDPAFILSLFTAALQEELTGMDWVEILRSNVLGLAVCALSSRNAGVRNVAGYVLDRSIERVQRTQFHEQLQTLHTLQLIANAIPAPAVPKAEEPSPAGQFGQPAQPARPEQPRLPSLITLFMAHALRAIAHPSSFLYPITSRFLLQRPILDAYDVPTLYGMLYAAGDSARRERLWVIRLLRDGVRSEADWRLCARRNTWSLLASLFQSSNDAGLRRAILAAMRSMVKIAGGARALMGSSLVNWLRPQWEAAPTRPACDEIRGTLLAILDEAVTSCAPHVVDAKRTRWVKDAEHFLALVAESKGNKVGVDVLAGTALRLAMLPANDCLTTLPPLVSLLVRSKQSDKDEHARTPSDDEQDNIFSTAVERLFRVSLTIPLRPVSAPISAAVRDLTPLVAALQGEVGDWAREEARRA